MPEPISGLTLAAELLRSGEAVRLPARGWSMFPAIADGDEIVVSPLRREPREGDVVFARRASGGSWVIHRVRSVGEGGVLLKGDASSYPDGWFPISTVLGVVGEVRRTAAGRIRRLGMWLRKGVGFLAGGLRRAARLILWFARPLLRSAIASRISFRPTRKIDGACTYAAVFRRHRVGSVALVRRPAWGAGTWEISGLHVNRWLRGVGIGSRLCRILLAQAPELAATRAVVLVDPGNASALGVYRRLGFAETTDGELAAHITRNDPLGRSRVVLEVPVASSGSK